MATPRKHWFKCPDSVADEDWSNDVLATLIRLQARLNTRWCRNGIEGPAIGEITLTAGDAMAVTRRSSFARASSVLRSCTHAVSLTCSFERAAVKILWPKWPEFQGLASRESPESRPRVAPSETQTQTQTQTQEEKRKPTPAKRARSRAAAQIDPRAEEVWPSIREAFASHGCALGERVGHDRAELIAKRLDEGATPDDLVAAVHGYVQIHDGLKVDLKSGFNPRKWFQPKTVFKHEAFSDRVDAGRSRNIRHIEDERMARLKERWKV